VTIEQKDVVDFISIDRNDNLVLTVCDHLEWDDELEHLFALQEKLNAYLSFIESGEIYERYPHDRAKNIVINVVCLHEINETSMALFREFQQVVQGAGFKLTIEHTPLP
jgi:hypothetical protein